MKRLILITLLAFGFATANAQFYRLRYDSVEVVSKFKLGTVTDGNSTDAILLRRDNGGVYKVAQSNFATTASLSNYVALTGNQTVAGQKTFTSSPQVNDAIYINNRTNTSGNSTVSYRTGGSTDWVHGTGISGAGSTSDWSLWKSNGTTAINVSYASNAVTFGSGITTNGITNINGALQVRDNWGMYFYNPSNVYSASLNIGTLTNNRDLRLPDESGTLSTATTKTLVGSGTGVATTISIAHGLIGITTSSAVVVTPNNAASAGISYATVDATNVNIVYTVAPANGTNNLLYSVTIK